MIDPLRKLYNQKKSRAEAIFAGLEKDGETRDMTADEAAEVGRITTEMKALKGQIEANAAAELPPEDEEERSAPPARAAATPPPDRRFAPMGGVPAVHTGEQKWSLLRALRLSLEKRNYDGLEGEIHQELAKKRSGPAEGILIPLGNEPEFRTALYGKNPERRDMTTTTGAGAVFITKADSFIELLRNKMVLDQLGVTYLTGMDGKFSIPRQNAASTAYWVAEGVSVTASNPTLDQVPLVDKTLGAMVNISRKFMYQSSVDAESFVRNDMAKVLSLELDRVAINGSGSGAQPLGILQNTTIQTASSGVAGGTNGLVPTFGQIVGMETQIAAANADRGSLKYLTTPALKGKLKQTPKLGSTFPEYLWVDDEINGYPAIASNQVPSNLTKGSGSALSAIIFGNWEDLIVATWGGIDTVVNPFTNQASGAVTISMMMEADIAVRHPESFSVILDAISV